MWTAIKLFLSNNLAKIEEGLIILATVAAAVIGIYQSGKKSEKTDELTSVLKDGETAHEIENDNRAQLRDGDAAQRLRDKWS